MNINDLTQKIVSEAQKLAGGILSAYQESEKELINSENAVRQSVADYLSVVKLTKETNEMVVKETQALRKEQESTQKQIDTLNSLISSFNAKELVRIELEDKIKSLTSKNLELESKITKDTESLDKLSELTLERQKELDRISREIVKGGLELDSFKDKLSKLNTKSVQELAAAEAKKNELLAELEPTRLKLLEKHDELTAKEKDLNKKESGLKVVEERYKQLFGEKGLVFKV